MQFYILKSFANNLIIKLNELIIINYLNLSFLNIYALLSI